MPTFDIESIKDELADILAEHDALMDAARGFGVRTAAIPRGLMPYREAQRIVTEVAASSQRLVQFADGLHSMRRNVPAEFETEWKALRAKVEAATDKFEADLALAREALARHEDLLVGENFQRAFEAVRIAVLDFDVADDVDLDFTTDLKLDVDPAYALGTVKIKKGTAGPYALYVGYRAVDDFYWGSIHSAKRGKTFKQIVQKTGHAHLPRFVRELTEQVKALDDADGTGVFRSRKKVDLRIVDPTVIQAALTPLLAAMIKARWEQDAREIPWSSRLMIQDTGDAGSAAVDFRGWGWSSVGDLGQARHHIDFYEEKRADLTRPFELTLPNGQVWEVTATAPPWTYKFTAMNDRKWRAAVVVANVTELAQKWPIEWSAVLRSVSIDALRARARALGVDPKYIASTSKVAIANAARNISGPVTDLRINSGEVRYTLRRKGPVRSSAERVAEAWLRTAGGCDFSVYINVKDAKEAFRVAVDEAQHEYGHRSYSGTIAEKRGFEIRKHEPMTRQQANEFIDRDLNRNDKWGPAFAVPVSEEKLLGTDTVTVTVEARDEADAQRRGTMLIKATGRVPPKATIQVTVLPKDVKRMGGGPRKGTFQVTGIRKQVVVGETSGWLFYGIASC